MTVTYVDDKKEKYQSVRAVAELSLTYLMGHGNLYVEGLGASKEEAGMNLAAALQQIIEEATYELHNIELSDQ